MTVVHQSIQQGGGHLGVAEHVRPLAERKVGGDYVELKQKSTFFAVAAFWSVRCWYGFESLE